jgi:hypothetical protein
MPCWRRVARMGAEKFPGIPKKRTRGACLTFSVTVIWDMLSLSLALSSDNFFRFKRIVAPLPLLDQGGGRRVVPRDANENKKALTLHYAG